jgi:hypothetical protein
MSWMEPDHREPEQEILERSPGPWSRALAWAERRLGLERLGRVSSAGRAGALGWIRRRPRRAAAFGVLGVIVLAGAATGIALTQHRPAPTQPPGGDLAVSGPPGSVILTAPNGVKAVTGLKQGSKRYVIIQAGSGAAILPASCSMFAGGAPTGLDPGGRTVLGDVVVPAARLDMLPNGNGEWRYWDQAVFLVRGGSPLVTISVPRAYESRAALDLEINGVGTTFHVKACPNPRDWSVDAGGFYLKAPAACIPLLVQAGARSATVWFGLGENCPVSDRSAGPR